MIRFIENGLERQEATVEGVQKLVDSGQITQERADEVIANYEAKIAKKLAKKTGKEYADTGVIVPFSAEDAVGLLQVKAGFEMGLQHTNIHFSNGQILPISAGEFNDFAVWFMTERARFFAE